MALFMIYIFLIIFLAIIVNFLIIFLLSIPYIMLILSSITFLFLTLIIRCVYVYLKEKNNIKNEIILLKDKDIKEYLKSKNEIKSNVFFNIVSLIKGNINQKEIAKKYLEKRIVLEEHSDYEVDQTKNKVKIIQL